MGIQGHGKSPLTPGTKTLRKDAEEEEETPEPLDNEKATLFRSWAARALYLSLDRPDIGFAAKELCRRMSAPSFRDYESLVRLVRYLANARWLKYVFRWQATQPKQLQVFVDTDYAGCKATRKSTSGGIALLGGHLIK